MYWKNWIYDIDDKNWIYDIDDKNWIYNIDDKNDFKVRKIKSK